MRAWDRREERKNELRSLNTSCECLSLISLCRSRTLAVVTNRYCASLARDRGTSLPWMVAIGDGDEK